MFIFVNLQIVKILRVCVEIFKNMKKIVMRMLGIVFVGAWMICSIAAKDTHERITKRTYNQLYSDQERADVLSTRTPR